MGSKRALSNGNEPEEAIDMIASFEQANSCKIIITSSLELNKGFLDWSWQASAKPSKNGELVANASDLANVRVWGGDYKTLMGLLIRLVYALDFQLALAEFERVEIKKA